jgi:beta-lactamase regulating signal transducer with metallopeptidase domain
LLWFLVFLRLVWPFHIASPTSLFEGLDQWSAWFLDQRVTGHAVGLWGWIFGWVDEKRVYFVWRVVATLFAMRLLASSLWNFWRLRSARPLTSWDAWWLFQETKQSFGLKSPVAVLESPNVSSPCLLGFFRPRIVIPEHMLKDLSMEEVRLVFLHELAHLRRGDLWLGWIFEGLRTIHWFNPAVWYACRRFHEDREEACDAAALAARPGANLTYGRLLLRFLSGSPGGIAQLNLAGFTDSATNAPELLLRRIKAIAHFRPENRSWMTGIAAVVIVVLVGFTEPKTSQNAPSSIIHSQMIPLDTELVVDVSHCGVSVCQR